MIVVEMAYAIEAEAPAGCILKSHYVFESIAITRPMLISLVMNEDER